MKTFPIHQVAAFADRPFTGNPAAVVPLVSWLDDSILVAIAAENNLSETAFIIRRAPGRYDIRWFTPTVEVELCGHATLASAWVIGERLGDASSELVFETRHAGPLRAGREAERVWIDLPAQALEPYGASAAVISALGGGGAAHALRSDAHVVTFGGEGEVRALRPDMTALAQALEADDLFAAIAAAPADRAEDCDVVARFFAPTKGVPEDPVTGSMWAALALFWCDRLGRDQFRGFQASRRGGYVDVSVRGDRAILSGGVQPYLDGQITA